MESLAFSSSVVNSYNAFAVNDWIVNATCPLTPCERCILAVIRSHADWITGRGSYPSLQTIAREAGCSRATVCRALNRFDELARQDDLPVKLKRQRRIIAGQYTSNLYVIETVSQVRLPSLMLRQELTSPNENLRRDVLALSSESRAEVISSLSLELGCLPKVACDIR
jgi:AraC-like DNA-binding protein